MIFLVNDANILIDLLKLNLLDTFFRLEYDFQVTDLVLSEVQEENVNQLTRYLESSLLKQQTFAFTELGEIGALNEEHPALSIPDCSCLYLAEKLEATLLTGDGALRRVSVGADKHPNLLGNGEKPRGWQPNITTVGRQAGPSGGFYHGNTKSHVFHAPDCITTAARIAL